MNENDVQDREVLDYVRNRMAADMPPEFTRDVMSDVHRTTQRRRGFAWPIFTSLATVAAAVAVVVIGLALINQPDGVGSESSPSPSASPAITPSPTPEASTSEEATPSPSAEPTIGEGEFGPIHSMAPDDAFANGQTCEVTNAIVNAEPTTLAWSISFPEGWSTNAESTDFRSSCTLFDSEPVDASDDQSTVAIVTETPPGGDFTTDGSSVTTTEYTVDGVAAVRYDIEPRDGGFVTAPMVVWVIAIAGNLPAEGNDQPYLIFQTYSDDPDAFAEWTDVLDRMVATLDIGE
jgi:hypothetical protein